MKADLQWGYDRLAARLDIASSDFFPAITIQQAASIKSKYWQVQPELQNIRRRCQQLLASIGVSAALYFAYHAAVVEMWKVTKTLGYGESAAIECAAIVVLYTSRGLSQTTLETLRTQIFGIVAPVGP